jgi:hypothetical protein
VAELKDPEHDEQLRRAQEQTNFLFSQVAKENSEDLNKPKDLASKSTRRISFEGERQEVEEGDFKVSRDKIKFTMFYDKEQERFFICENAYELQKYFVLEYDEQKAMSGTGNHLMVTVYTVVSTNLLTAEIGRGKRGIEIDTKEVMAMRNIVHFNCQNPFVCKC